MGIPNQLMIYGRKVVGDVTWEARWSHVVGYWIEPAKAASDDQVSTVGLSYDTSIGATKPGTFHIAWAV